MTKMNKALVLLFFLIVPIIAVFSQAADVEADVTPFTLLYETTGSVSMVNRGVGTSATGGTGTITNVTIPGSVVKAYLLWQGRDVTSSTGVTTDPDVTLTVDAGSGNAVSSSITHSHVQEDNAERTYYSYLADVTTILQGVSAGSHNYTMTNFDLMDEEFGFGLFVIYDTGTTQVNNIRVIESFDRFWINEPNNLQGEVHCIDFAPVTVSRVIDLDMIAAGIGFERDNQIYYQTGTGTKPTDLQVTGSLLEVQPFGQYDGADWDSYENGTPFNLPANDTWACVQITINDGTAPGQPASGMIQLVSMMVPTTTPTAVSLQGVAATAAANPLPFVAALFLVLAGTGIVLYNRRQS